MEKDTINIMFDTNIFLDFTFIYYKEEKRSPLPKHLENLTPLLMAFENNTFNNIMSLWNIFELRDKLMQFKLREAYILAGYSFGEFRDAEDIGIDLNKEDVEGVEIMIKSFLNKSIQKTELMDLKKIEEIAKKGFSFMDIVLIYQAELNKCDYFVTREKALCSSEYLKKEFNLKICHPKEFINIIGYDKVKKIRYSIPLKPK